MTPIKLLLGAAVLAAAGIVAIAGAWYLFIREDAELATSAPEIPADVAATGTAAPTTIASTDNATEPASSGDIQTYTIVPNLSEAAYFVDEELASIGLPSTAKGATNDISGAFYLTADGAALASDQPSTFTVDLTTLRSDESRRDNRVQQALETGQFPQATFTITSVTGYDPSIAEGVEQILSMSGTLDLHGVQKDLTWELKAKREGDAISGLATVTFAFADFDITPPNIGGFVSVGDNVTLQVQLVAERA